jgi:hypothetical protein
VAVRGTILYWGWDRIIIRLIKKINLILNIFVIKIFNIGLLTVS